MENASKCFQLFSVLVFGFNIVTQVWSDLPRFTKDRGYHGIASFGGQLYVTGGYCNVNSETLDIGNELARLTISLIEQVPCASLIPCEIIQRVVCIHFWEFGFLSDLYVKKVMQCSFKWLLLFKKGIRGNRPYDFLLLFLQQRKQLFSTYFYKINHTHHSFFLLWLMH